MTLSVQFTTMFAMVLSGLYLGMIRDTYLYFTKYWKENTIFAYVMEISFWLSQTFILYSVLFFCELWGTSFIYFFSLSFRICNISSLDCKCISKNIAVCDPWVYGFMSSGKEHNQSTDCKTSSIDFTALCSTYHAYFKNNYFSSRDHDKTSLYTY